MKWKIYVVLTVTALFFISGADQLLSFCLIRGNINSSGGEDCCAQDISQWRFENLPVPLWINDETDPDLWEGIRHSYDTWGEVTSAYLTIEDAGFTPINYVNTNDGVNVVSFSNDTSQFPPGSNTLAFTSGNWGVNVGDDETITGFDVIFNDVGFDWGWPPIGNQLSVVGVTIHEVGHALGLAHCKDGGPPGCGPNCPGSTMYGYISGNGVADESPEIDDIGSLTLAYPRWLIRGTVSDAGSGLPIPSAEVLPSVAVFKDTLTYGTLPDPMPGNGSSCGYRGDVVTADQDGFFEFPSYDSVYTLIFFKSGYTPDSTQVAFSGIDTTTLDIELEQTVFSSITGTLTDGNTQEGVRGAIVLYMNGAAYDTTYTNETTGDYTFSDVPISLPGFVDYTGIEILAVIPYPLSTMIETGIEVGEGGPTVLNFSILPAEVFLVDDDGGSNYEEYFYPAIDSAGRTFVRFDVKQREASAVNLLSEFPSPPTVVSFTGDEAERTITLEELDSLQALLDEGGRVLLTGQNLVEDLWNQDSNRVIETLHISYEDNISGTISFGRGFEDVPIGERIEKILTAGNNGGNNQISKDKISPLGDAFSILYYTLSPVDTVNQGIAAVAEDNLGTSGEGKLVLLGFGFEALNRPNESDPSIVSRKEAMRIFLDWLQDIPTGIEPEETEGGLLPRVFSLEQNFPNPFNPQTSIQFKIPSISGDPEESEAVLLKVYNMRGRFITELINRDLTPGVYTIHWDEKDSRGNNVPSGTYLYKLIWGQTSTIRKMVVLK